jgi:hypothetical protein
MTRATRRSPWRVLGIASASGLPDVFFQTKNPNFGKFWRALDCKMFIYFMTIRNILWRFWIFYDHLLHFVFIWYILYGFGIMSQEKSGNPAPPAAEETGVYGSRDRIPSGYRMVVKKTVCADERPSRDGRKAHTACPSLNSWTHLDGVTDLKCVPQINVFRKSEEKLGCR